jgi:PAS domain S-box-containing protein
MGQTAKITIFLIFSTILICFIFVLSAFFLKPANFIFYIILLFSFYILILNLLALFSLKNKKKTIQPTVPSQPLTVSQQEKLKEDTILANIGEGLVIINTLGEIITFNKAAELLLGWSEQEALGKNLSEIIKIDYNSKIQVRGHAIGNTSSLYFVRKDKTTFPSAITSSSYVQNDKVLVTITLFRDITTETNIDKMKNEFISLVSHQLRTPLAAIKWYSEMLMKGDAGKLLSEQQEYADSIYTSTEQMINLVNSLLNISRIESGRIIIEPKPTDVEKLATEVLDEVKIRYADKKQHISFTGDDIPLISIDPQLIRQVYVNLLTNAAKYTPEKGEISVKITKNDKEIISEIKDKGFGIPEDEQKKVFEKFYRGKNMINSDNNGTGLGLYLVKSIVELSQGKIWFKSQKDKGTIFWFSLPLAGTPAKKGVLSLEI